MIQETLQKISACTNASHQGSGQYKGTCPICNKKDHFYFSLNDNKIVMYCQHCRADFKDFCNALGITRKECFETSNKPIEPITREHIYTSEQGDIIAKKVITRESFDAKKSAKWFRYNNGEWDISLKGLKPPLFDVCKVIKEQDTVYITEGEKDALTLQNMGFTATTSPNGAGPKWKTEYNKYIQNKNVVLIGDNDKAGQDYISDIAEKISDDVKTIKIISVKDILPTIKEKGDITDVAEIIGYAEAKKRLLEQVNKVVIDWVRPYKNGYSINEPLFSDYFISKYKVCHVNNNFYNESGQLKEKYIQQLIQQEIEPYITSGIAAKVKGLCEAIEIKCHTEQKQPSENIIHCKNTDLILNDDSTISTKEAKGFCFNKLDIEYNANALKPTKWIEFLNGLLYEDDIQTLQEYLGYCLVPTTIAQKSMFIVGKGGEGKSRIGVVLQNILQGAFVSDKLHRLETDKYLLSALENKLMFYDDDLNTEKLKETGTFKQLVTNELSILVESKYESKYELRPYTRFLCCGNQAIGSCFDHTDGFYRRLIVLTCKPKTRLTDNTEFTKELLKEKDGIFNWCLEGLQRLKQNGFNFNISDRAAQTLENIKTDECNILQFMKDNFYVEYSSNGNIFSKDLLSLYKNWCYENGLEPLADRTFMTYLKDNQIKFNITYKDQVVIGGHRARGYSGIKLANGINPTTSNYNFRVVANH